MEIDYCIIPECFVDTMLIETLVKPTRKLGYNHRKGCTVVTNAMKNEKKLKEGFALGIVDKDKKTLPYSKEFETIFQTNNLELMKHKTKNHYLIFIIPVIEKWLIANADEIGINLIAFGLPHNSKQLGNITKDNVLDENTEIVKNLKNLFKTLKEKGAKSVLILTYWVEYLKNNPYKADLEILKTETTKIIN